MLTLLIIILYWLSMDFYKKMYDLNQAGRTFVLATLIKTVGSSPRRPGAKMLILPDGTIYGTIGGGTFEKNVIEDCLNLLKSGSKHLLKHYSFTIKGEGSIGMTCGGKGDVFMEVNLKPNNLIIFGGGHVGRKLTRLATGSGFNITVVDDRRDILDKFDDSISTILTDPDYHENFPPLDNNSYVVIVTKSHKNDQPVLEQVINKDCAYVGMIGAKSKIKMIFASLEKSGIKKKDLEKVYAPIGLDIGSEGPYEIAVSILAEIIEVKQKISRKK
jgi:xanthine dehydrogenase accessory factor